MREWLDNVLKRPLHTKDLTTFIRFVNRYGCSRVSVLVEDRTQRICDTAVLGKVEFISYGVAISAETKRGRLATCRLDYFRDFTSDIEFEARQGIDPSLAKAHLLAEKDANEIRLRCPQTNVRIHRPKGTVPPKIAVPLP